MTSSNVYREKVWSICQRENKPYRDEMLYPFFICIVIVLNIVNVINSTTAFSIDTSWRFSIKNIVHLNYRNKLHKIYELNLNKIKYGINILKQLNLTKKIIKNIYVESFFSCIFIDTCHSQIQSITSSIWERVKKNRSKVYTSYLNIL